MSHHTEPPEVLTRQHALVLDSRDELRRFRERFYIPRGVLYFDGNSLGLLSKDAERAVLQVLADWRTHGIDGWTGGGEAWFDMPERYGALCAPLVGAKEHEVVISGSTTVNLHTLLASFYKPEGERLKILADIENFPSDLYALDSQLRLHGRPTSDLVLIEPEDNGLISTEAIIEAMTDDISLVLLPSVWYKSGQLAQMELITKAAHERGILIGFDLCHSVGVVPHELHDWNVDFAVWCNYKYLSGGPGSTAGLFVHERHHHMLPGLAGWFGSHKGKQFDMAFPMHPAQSATQWQLGTPPILSTAPVGAAIKLTSEAGIEQIRAKSLSQTAYLRALIEARILDEGLGGSVRTPREDAQRGGHIAFEHPEAVRLGKALRKAGVIPDFRPPKTLRFAPAPLYTSYTDIWDAVEIIRDILTNGKHLAFSPNRDVVS